jgi:hypothetical protein
MAKNREFGTPPSERGGDHGSGGAAHQRRPLPRPNVSVPEQDDDPSTFGEAAVRGMVMNPIYAGVGPYLRMIADDQWVACARKVLAEDGPDQFLVNLLYVLRRSFGCVEWGGDLPPASD